MIDFEQCQPQIEKLKAESDSKGYVTLDYIQEVFPVVADEDLDAIYDYLDSQNIYITRDEKDFLDSETADIEKDLNLEETPDDLEEQEPTDEELEEEEVEVKLSEFDTIDTGTHQTDDIVRLYLHEIGQVDLLDSIQEVQYANLVQIGIAAQARLDQAEKAGKELSAEERADLENKVAEGLNAQDILITANLRLVVSIAKRYTKRGLQLADLIQEGNLGLAKAVVKFDTTRGCKFSTYATWWIRQGIVRAIADKGRNVRIPVHMHESINKLGREKRRLIQELHREPTIDELAEAMGKKPEQIVELQRVALDSISFDATVGDEDDSTLIDLVPDDKTQSPSEYAEDIYKNQVLNDLLQTLTPREEMVIRYRFGIGVDHPHTLEEVGKIMNVTRERVRQIEQKAQARLRTHAKKLGIKHF